MNTQMTTTEALDILQAIGTSFGTGLLEVMTYMRDNIDDFSLQEKRAFRIVFADMSRLFA